MKIKGILTTILLLISVSYTQSQFDFQSSYQSIVCPEDWQVPDNDNIDCGYLTVPENRNDPEHGTIQLAVVILRSHNASPEPDPIVYLEGGPGGSAISGLDLWLESPLRDDRDLILLDQRGTGFSEPSLLCVLPDNEAAVLDEQQINTLRDDFDKNNEYCNQQLQGRGVHLASYNTNENAADVADLRSALNIQTWNLYGISYGTRVALEVMRDHPQGIRSVILDGVYPADVDVSQQPLIIYQAFTNLFDACRKDLACNQAFPNLESRFYSALNQLDNALEDKKPNSQFDSDFDEQGWGISEMAADDIVNELFMLMYDTSIIPSLPLIIDAIIRDDDDDYWRAIGFQDVTDSQSSPEDVSIMQLSELIPQLDEQALAFVIKVVDVASVDELQTIEERIHPDDYIMLLGYIESYIYAPENIEVDRLMMEYLDVQTLYELDSHLMEMDDAAWVEINNYVDQNLQYEQLNGGLILNEDTMYYSVECNERYSLTEYEISAEIVSASNMPEIMKRILLDQQRIEFDKCSTWPSGQAQLNEVRPTISDIPTLIVSGQFDPITPVQFGDMATSHLSNGYHFVIPWSGHGSTPEGCGLSIMRDFLITPSEKPDAHCLSDIHFQFYTDIPTIVK